MKKALVSLAGLVLIISVAVLNAQTVFIAQDTIWGNTVWDYDTVKVEEDIVILEGAKLSIKAGTFVKLNGEYAIYVHGYLQAVGDPGDSIIFTNPSGTWMGIGFLEGGNHSDTSKLEYCKISGVHKLDLPLFTPTCFDSDGAVFISSDHKILIQDCLIENNYAGSKGGGVAITESIVGYVKISNSCFRYNHAEQSGNAIHIEGHKKTIISGNRIINNEGSYGNYGGGGIYIRQCDALISRNIIVNN